MKDQRTSRLARRCSSVLKNCRETVSRAWATRMANGIGTVRAGRPLRPVEAYVHRLRPVSIESARMGNCAHRCRWR
ncbi:hypothetical protein NUV26_27600 [Burkholderia pseudomultivorans]|uniref:hypothetical protein n=1 Tax=Burkholderia pseudomultivorans TaxID=1207504 RepID=UPI001186F486|nr:hypothetical protein [Burkholderia pseudomultivorans]MDS0795942.1 hypothetical protein [Burkholderia pseudomultivorans]MDS0857779.1 hypothetical protein [Burkholderia pseudomultivorans]